jgi:hypothetical protein
VRGVGSLLVLATALVGFVDLEASSVDLIESNIFGREVVVI